MEPTPKQSSTGVDEQKLKEQFEGHAGPEGGSSGQEDLHLQGQGGYARTGQDVSETPERDSRESVTEKELETGGHARHPQVGEEERGHGGSLKCEPQ